MTSENQESIRKLDSINTGFAARCEARLRLAVENSLKLWPKSFGQSPNQGRSPTRKLNLDGAAQPRLTSGGEAGAIDAILAGAITRHISGSDTRHISRSNKGIAREATNIITLHLGNGCSIAAIKDGNSIDTSMGFTPLEGLVMGTRSGDLDPSIVDFISAKEGFSTSEVESLLNKQSGQ